MLAEIFLPGKPIFCETLSLLVSLKWKKPQGSGLFPLFPSVIHSPEAAALQITHKTSAKWTLVMAESSQIAVYSLSVEPSTFMR